MGSAGENLESKNTLSEDDQTYIRERVEQHLQYLENQERKRVGARVFCVACGAHGRVPLRRWHNSYICNDCWKILQKVGEDRFIKALKGEEE